ncbi:MAG: LytTR family transcriptional regulator DNA-binding domain-containing protein [Bacteroidales bacterium]|nr:LytTR family transcriptional regulator DNA-binding domain-containing protein [Bacteroidales bacterium]
MDKIIIIDDSGIQNELEKFLIANKKHIRLSSDMDELSLSNNSILSEIIKRYEDKHKLKIQTKNKIRFYKSNEIIRFEAKQDKTIIFLSDNTTYEIDVSIDGIDSQLKSFSFIRIHDNHIINMNYISKISGNFNAQIELTNRETIPVAKNRKKHIMDSLNKHI